MVRLNAAIVSAYAEGPAAGLRQLDALAGHAKLERYAQYHAARGDLLARLGRSTEAGEAFRRALGCTLNGAEREYLTKRLSGCEGGEPRRAAPLH